LINLSNREETQEDGMQCNNHEGLPFECKENAIYSVGFTCNREYIGQSYRCVNTRFLEHKEGKNKYSSYQQHINRCKCDVKQVKTFNNKPIKGGYVRQILETICIEESKRMKGDDMIISNPSIIPTERERMFIEKKIKWTDEF
jgi:hypothetical protein